MKPELSIIHHLVKGEDINHHGTLYAGQGAKWFVEAGFIAAANITDPANTVCLKVHGMLFKKPVRLGTIIRFESKVIYAGKTSLVTYVKVVMSKDEEFIFDGFLTFIHLDQEGEPLPHGITIEALTAEDKLLQEKARQCA